MWTEDRYWLILTAVVIIFLGFISQNLENIIFDIWVPLLKQWACSISVAQRYRQVALSVVLLYAFLLQCFVTMYITSSFMLSHFQFNALWLAAHKDTAKSVRNSQHTRLGGSALTVNCVGHHALTVRFRLTFCRVYFPKFKSFFLINCMRNTNLHPLVKPHNNGKWQSELKRNQT